MVEKDQQVIIQEEYENPPTQLLPPRIFLASKEKNGQPTNQPTQPTNQQCGWCSTNTLLLICSPFSRENGHPGCSFAHLYTYIHTDIAPKNHPNQPNQSTERKSSTFKAFQRLLNNVIKAERMATCLTGKCPSHPGVFVRRSERVGNRFREGEIPGFVLPVTKGWANEKQHMFIFTFFVHEKTTNYPHQKKPYQKFKGFGP